MLLPRTAHTATLLQDGHVLIAGGDPCSAFSVLHGDTWDPCPVELTELYDPGTGLFVGGASMSAQRTMHTATLLPDGRVLIAGGGSASAELYDPTTGTFSPTGSLSMPRSGHTATLLADGRVLIAGGGTTGALAGTAELYDPQAGVFLPTSGTGLLVPRIAHTATRLLDGKVLLLGGLNSSDSSESSVEHYDPTTESFTLAGNLGDFRRAYHTATLLLDGTVLITGGFRREGGGGSTFSSGLIFDPASGTSRETGQMESRRTTHFAVLLNNGKVLVSGGDYLDPFWRGYIAELFDPTTGRFERIGSMASLSRNSSAAVLLGDGRVLVTGGNGAPEFASAEIFQ
jgi:hypothetical protein